MTDKSKIEALADNHSPISNHETLEVGGKGKYGNIILRNASGEAVISLNSGSDLCISTSYCGPTLYFKNSQSEEILSLRSDGSILIGGLGVRGGLSLINSNGKETNKFDGNANVWVGGGGSRGDIYARDADGNDIVHISGDGNVWIGNGNGKEGKIYLNNGNKLISIKIDSDGRMSIMPSVSIGSDGVGGQLFINDYSNKVTTNIDAEGKLSLGDNGYDGLISIIDYKGRKRVCIGGHESLISIMDDKGNNRVIIDGNSDLTGSNVWRGGAISLKDDEGSECIRIKGNGDIEASRGLFIGKTYKDGKEYFQGGFINIYDDWNDPSIQLSHSVGSDASGSKKISADITVGNWNKEGAAGNIYVNNEHGEQGCWISGSHGKIHCSGGDCAEEFEVVNIEEIEPGMVLVTDDKGRLSPSEIPFDKKVVGVASGGNGYGPGIVLGSNTDLITKFPVALAGKVYCQADAMQSPIHIGDLLTTSRTKGHAMKADDPIKAFGSIIGKSLGTLVDAKGLIPILISLQ